MIERLDARAQHWRQPFRASYRSLKWLLIMLGAYILIGLSLQRFGVWGSLVVWGGFFAAGFSRGLLTAWRAWSLRRH